MQLRPLWLLYQREMRSTLRERNVILYVVLVPLLLYPFLLWLAMSAASILSAEEERAPVRVALISDQAHRPANLLRALESQRVTLVQTQDAPADLRRGVIDAILEMESERQVRLVYDGRFRQSLRAQQRLRPLVSRYREVRLEEMALEGGATLQELQPVYFESRDESSSDELGRYILGTFLPLTLMVVLALGGLYPAVEAFAGEHERLTLDTTLLLGVSRGQIILSKYMLVASLCTLSGACNLLAVTISLRAILAPLSSTLAERISWGWSLQNLAIVSAGIAGMSMLVAAATLLFTAHARSFREGQAATTPLFIAILLPASALVDRTLSLDFRTCWLPVVNVALLWRDSLTARVDPKLALLTCLACLLWVGVCLALLTWRLQRQSRAIGLVTERRNPK